MRAAFLSCVFLVIFLVHFGESKVRVKRIVGGQAAAVPPEDDPVVYVYKEDHDARVLGIRERKGGFYTYQGIRYAFPPTGIYRFQRPRPMKMEGLINATRPPPPCPQPDPSKPGRIIGSEDCLFLNIYSAELPDGSSAGLPVLVWIHGGGYRRGSANQYGPGPLIKKKVVLVSIQYRLGSLGFLSAGAPQLSGNVGMFDMTAAIRWVQNYISFFGGDPKNIKTIGQGSGASSAVALGLSPVSQTKVNGVVAMSGSAVSPNAVDQKPKEATSELADLVGCPSTPALQLVRCLQQVKVEDLVEADSKLQAFRLAEQGTMGSLGGVVSPAPVVDGNSVAGGRSLDDGDDDRFLPSFLPEPPIKTLNESEFPAIPLLTGVCKQETGRAVAGEVQAKLTLFKDKISGISNYVNNIIGNQLSGFASKALPLADGLAKLANPLTKNPLFGAASGVASSAAMSASDAINAATQRVAEATTDVLFNLPAALTTSFWSQRAPAFLYSLEHPSKRAAALGQQFLAGLPVIESGRGVNEANQSVSHGDDLAFLFNARTLEGKNNDDELSLTDAEDLKLRDYFTSLVAEFARSGTASVPGDKNKDKKEKKSIWSSFSGGKGANYLVLDGAPRLGSDFRTCQLAVWTGVTGGGGGGDGKDCHILGELGKAFGGVAGAVSGVFGGGGGGGGPLGLPLGGGGGGAPGGAPGGAGAAKPKNGTAAASPKKRRKTLREKPKGNASTTPKPK